MAATNKEPFIHMSKRDTLPWQKAWTIRFIAIIAALLVCALVTTVLTGDNPIKVYATIVEGAFGTSRKTWITMQNL